LEKKRVLIHVDLKRRDLAPACFLKYELERLGFEVELCSRLTARFTMASFKPHVFINSHSSMCGLKNLQKWVKECQILVMPTEGAIDFKALFLADVQGDRRLIDGRRDKTFVDLVTTYFSWGKKQGQWLVEENIFLDRQVKTVGSPRYDTRLLKTDLEREGKPIGFLANFSRISPFDGRSILTMIDNERKEHGGIYVEGREMEGGFWCIYATARLMFEMLDRQKQAGRKVLLRPHPNENLEAYDDLLDRYSGVVELSTGADVSDFLREISVMVCMMSTAVIDAMHHKVPTICLEAMLGDGYLEHVDHPVRRKDYLDWLWRPKNHQELENYLISALKGELEVCPDLKKFGPYLEEVYSMPSQKTSSYKIAKEVEKIAVASERVPSPPRFYSKALLFLRIFVRYLQNLANRSQRISDAQYHLLLRDRRQEERLLESYAGIRGEQSP